MVFQMEGMVEARVMVDHTATVEVTLGKMILDPSDI